MLSSQKCLITSRIVHWVIATNDAFLCNFFSNSSSEYGQIFSFKDFLYDLMLIDQQNLSLTKIC